MAGFFWPRAASVAGVVFPGFQAFPDGERIGIPVAAGVLYPFFEIRLSPVIAAAAMALSSLSVVTNANRLRRYHPAPLPAAAVARVEPQVETGAAHSDGASGHDGAAGLVTAADPVCAMHLDPATAPAHRRTGTVFFCSAGCAATSTRTRTATPP